MMHGISLVHVLFALSATLALMLGLALILRKVSPEHLKAMGMKRLRKVESLNLTAQHGLHVVSVDGVERVFTTGPQGVRELRPKREREREI